MKTYKVRYSAEIGEFSPKRQRIAPGISKADDDAGYADEIFVASIMKDPSGEIGSIMLMSTEEGPVSRRLLEAVRDQIIHHLEHHCEE